jgi:PAS domain S-box-containing protein
MTSDGSGSTNSVADHRQFEALSRSNSIQALQRISDQTKNAVFARDTQGRFLLANPAYMAPIQANADLVGRRSSEVFDPEMQAQLGAEDRRVIDTGEALITQWNASDTMQQQQYFVAKYPLFNDFGIVVGVAGLGMPSSDWVEQPSLESSDGSYAQLAFDQAPIGVAVLDLELRYLQVNPALSQLSGYAHTRLLGRSSYQHVHPADRAPLCNAFFELLSGLRADCRLEQRHLRPDGSIIWVRLHVRLLRNQSGQPLAFLLFVDDLSGQKAMLTALGEQLNSATRIINSSRLDPEVLYGAIHCAVELLMPVDVLVISLVEKNQPFVDHVYNYDERVGLCDTERKPLQGSFAAFMMRYGPVLRVDDFLMFQHPEISFEVFGSEDDTRSAVAASFTTGGGLFGLLFVQSYPPNVYTDNDLTILELLAAHAATAIENVRHAQNAQRNAIDAERNRLARDLHDSVSQSLFSASLIAERLPAMAHISTKEAWQGLEALHQLVRNALSEMRALLIELRPGALAESPLHQAIQLLTNAFAGRSGVVVSVLLDPAPKLPPEVQLVFYRIVQESLMNIIKHAYADKAGVEMTVTPPVNEHSSPWQGTIILRISDDGRGFNSRAVEPHQLGLGIMRERAAELGAELTIESAPGKGTRTIFIWHGSALDPASKEMRDYDGH